MNRSNPNAVAALARFTEWSDERAGLWTRACMDASNAVGAELAFELAAALADVTDTD